MEVFQSILFNILFLAAGLLSAVGAYLLYNRMPPAWFWDPDVKDPSLQPDPRMRRFPDRLWFCAALVFASFLFYLQCGFSLLLCCNLFSLFLLAYIIVADLKIRMIPDPFTAALLFISLLYMVNDLFALSESGDPWYGGILMRLLGGAIGGGVLGLIRILGSKAFRREAMGMGDVKLLAACGLLTGFDGIFWVLGLSFLFAFFPALISLIREKKRRSAGPSPELPFAPFAAIATVLWLLFPADFTRLADWYGRLVF